MFAVLVQLILYLLLEVQRPVLASLVELENNGLAQPALTVLLARIRAQQVTSSQHVATALLEPTDHRLAFRLTPVVELLPVPRVNTL